MLQSLIFKLQNTISNVARGKEENFLMGSAAPDASTRKGRPGPSNL
jgi:hypothetical protein